MMITAALLLSSTVAVSQEQPSLRDRAEELYRRYEYANAAKLYAKLVDTKRPRLADLERLADSYVRMNDYESAENWYARVIAHEDSPAANLLHYGDVLKANGKYAEAKAQLQRYAEQTGDTEGVALQIAGCDSALVWMASPTVHKLHNESINTSLSEFSAFPVGETVYYAGEPQGASRAGTYGWTGNAFLRVYTAGRDADNILSGAALGGDGINSGEYHVGPVAADATGSTLFVTRTYVGKDGEETKEDRRKYRTNKLELYIHTKQDDGSWAVEPFAYNNVQAYSVGHAALSADGNTLYFASDRPDGYGGTDIWYSEQQADGSWGEPVNAGPAINSAGDELFPNIGPDNQTLYYSSDGFAGMGGLDVFEATGSKDQWATPHNLRYPVNSPGDDFAYLLTAEDEEGMAGYLSSNRKGGQGGDDIYSFSFEKPRIVIVLKGTTANKQTGERIEATVTLFDGTREIVAKKSSGTAGAFEFVLDRNQSYTVLAHKEGYHADSAQVSTEGITKSDTIEVALLLEPVFKVGDTFELENIYYDFDKDNIRPDAAAILDELVRTMRDNPTLKIELSSHTDSRGSDAYNEDLSQRRAQSAVDYLVSRGIARDRMVAKGYGETRLVNECADGVPCSREAHQANRRTEVTVLEF